MMEYSVFHRVIFLLLSAEAKNSLIISYSSKLPMKRQISSIFINRKKKFSQVEDLKEWIYTPAELQTELDEGKIKKREICLSDQLVQLKHTGRTRQCGTADVCKRYIPFCQK